jgi:hypothetical protein
MVGRQVLVLLLALVLVASVRAAAPVTDEQRLALLAGKMLNITPQGDYAMDCGPGKEVLNLQARQSDLRDAQYCILNTSGTIIYGTFSPFTSGDLKQKLAELITVYNDSAYRAQIQTVDVNPKACDAIVTSATATPLNGFVECPGAIKYTMNGAAVKLYTYVYTDDTNTGATYLIVSEKKLTDLQGGILSSIGNTIASFFKWFLGWL